MSARLTRAAEQDDAAFRARLAPLASEVLPGLSIVRPRPVAKPRFRRWVIALTAAAATGAAVFSATWLAVHWGSPHEAEVREAAPAVAAAPPAPVVPAPERAAAEAASNEMIDLLLHRGDVALIDGDIVGARLLFERAAELGSGIAATATGKTYDAEFLARAGARGIRSDQAAAAAWFRKAAALGDTEAGALLARTEGRPRP